MGSCLGMDKERSGLFQRCAVGRDRQALAPLLRDAVALRSKLPQGHSQPRGRGGSNSGGTDKDKEIESRERTG